MLRRTPRKPGEVVLQRSSQRKDVSGRGNAGCKDNCILRNSEVHQQEEAQGNVEHRIRPTKKPDWDNIGKIVCDSLNLVAYHDDSAVVDAQVRKFYSETPRVDVMIKVVGPDQI